MDSSLKNKIGFMYVLEDIRSKSKILLDTVAKQIEFVNFPPEAYGKYEMFGLSVEIPAKCFHSQGCPVNSSCLGSMGAEEAFSSFECLVSKS